MDTNITFDWVPFYKEFAEKLLAFKNKRQELINLIKENYSNTGIDLPTLDYNNDISDIDPFTVFGLFNKNSQKEENRIKILVEFSKQFSIKASVPKSFEGIPTVMNLNATFYKFSGERGETDIDDLWELFEAALDYQKSQSAETKDRVSKYYDICINMPGNGAGKTTMALYWIAPDFYINLDRRNHWYIFESGKIPEKVLASISGRGSGKTPASVYFEIINKMQTYFKSSESPFKNFLDLSYEAWRYSEEVNKQIKAEKIKVKSTDLSTLKPNENKIHYWLYAPGANAIMWDDFYKNGIMAVWWNEIGDLSQYATKDEMKIAMKEKIDSSKSFKNDAHATWQFVHELKVGDIVFVKQGMHKMLGRGVVKSEYQYDETKGEYPNIRKVEWTNKGEYEHPDGQAVLKTLTDVTSYIDYVEKLKSLFVDDGEEIEDEETVVEANEIYTKEDFLKEVYMTENEFTTIKNLLEYKKNIILQGAPGVGKTFAAKRLAFALMGEKDESRVRMIQFHQSYSYEDFIMGYRPTETGFKLETGVFYEFCKEAEKDDEQTPYFFIIDEVNRGNLSKIFGELFMLIESDKREQELRLLYKKEMFSVPKNVFIIGLMNTADRSLAMLDYALRRRFAFFNIKPGFDTKGFYDYKNELKSEKFDKLINTIKALNSVIENDSSLGKDFCIGHSYFCNLKSDTITDSRLREIVEYEIIPLLDEYWFDENDKVKQWAGNLIDSIK